MKYTNKLRTQVTVIVVLSFLVFAFILSFINLYSTYMLLQEESQQRLINMAKYQAAKLDANVIKRKTVSESIKIQVTSQFDYDRAISDESYWDEFLVDIEPFIYNTAIKYDMAYVYLNPFIHKKGRDVWYWDRDLDGIPERQPGASYEIFQDETNKEWFFIPMKERIPNWTDPYPSTILDKEIKWISYTIPIYIKDLFVGVVGSDLFFNRFEEAFRDITVYNTGYAVLINAEGDFIVHPEIEEDVNLKAVSGGEYAWMMDEIESKPAGTFEYTWLDGQDKILAFNHVSNGWVVGITAEKSEIYGSLIRGIKILVVAIGLGVTITGIIIFTMLKQRMEMLEGVTKTISDIGDGNYDIKISDAYLNDTSEVGQLAGAVKVMKNKQKQAMEEIKNYSENLKGLVEERTIELEETNQELETSIDNLKNTQDQLVESQKKEAISRLIVEIAHRMNTPLGNVSMSVSYLDHVIEKIKCTDKGCIDEVLSEVLDESMSVIGKGIDELSEIVRGLQLLNMKIENKSVEPVQVKDIISLGLSDFNALYPPENQLHVDFVDSEDLIMKTSPVHLMEAFHYLFKYSVDFSMEKTSFRSACITINKTENRVILKYEDNSSLRFSDIGDRAFEPFALSAFNKGASGIELMMAYNIVSVGLKGVLECLEREDGKPYFLMVIPFE